MPNVVCSFVSSSLHLPPGPVDHLAIKSTDFLVQYSTTAILTLLAFSFRFIMPFAIQPCVPEDAPGLAAAIVAARLNDPHWTSLWKDPSAESQIAKTTDCIPWSLVTSTDTKRHQKVIDVESGQVAGYARWCLPPILVTRGDVWLDARVAEGTTADRAAYEKQCQEQTQNGQFKGLKDEDQIRYRTAPVEEADARIRRDGHFLSKMHIKV